MDLQNKADRGDVVLSCTPATLTSSAAAVTAAISGAAAKFTRAVLVQLKTATGEIHEWFNGSLAIAIADTATGTAAIAGGATTVPIVNGQGVVVIEYTGAWASTNTCTLTVTGGTMMGVTVANKTSVDTLGV